jgi:hypothetical protein
MRDDKLELREEVTIEEGVIPTNLRELSYRENLVDPDEMGLLRGREDLPHILQIEDEKAFDAALKEIRPVYEEIKVLNEVVDPLGIYESSSRIIEIDPRKITDYEELMWSDGVNIWEESRHRGEEILRRVVELHLEAHALHHLAKDPLNEGRIWEEFADTSTVLKEILAQLFTFHECQDDPSLLKMFMELEKRQSIEYRLWGIFKYVPKEVLYWLIRERPQRIKKLLERMGFKLPRKRKASLGTKLKRIAKVINSDTAGEIRGEDIPGIVSEEIGEKVNCYPGVPGDVCHKKAFFISVTTGRHADPGKGHLNFRQVLECFIQHMQGHCYWKTEEAVIMVDSWDSDAWQAWHGNIRWIKSNAHVEVYLMVGDKVSFLNV